MNSSILFFTLVAVAGLGALALSILNAVNWQGEGKYLCDDCQFNDPKDCLKAERPAAISCTSYRAKAHLLEK